MLNLPQSTEFNRRIPKQKFYNNLSVTPALKKLFTEQIQVICWQNKIAPSTANIAPGEIVTEVQVFEIELTSPQLDTAVLQLIDKEIPYHIVFLLKYDEKYQAWTAYKEHTAGNVPFKVGKYYHTGWLNETDLPLKLDGLNMDTVYENFVRQIAGDNLTGDSNETLQQSMERNEKREQLEKQITALQGKIRKEKQLNKQVEMNTELKRLKSELEKVRQTEGKR